MDLIKKAIPIGKILILVFSLIGITGSFSLSASGEIPCPYCLIARYSLVIILLLSLLALFLKKNPIYIGTAIISILPIVASSILVYNDYFVQGGTEICYSENSDVHCTSPLVFGIHVSLYALLISLAILFLSLLLITGSFIVKKYEGTDSCRKHG